MTRAEGVADNWDPNTLNGYIRFVEMDGKLMVFTNNADAYEKTGYVSAFPRRVMQRIKDGVCMRSWSSSSMRTVCSSTAKGLKGITYLPNGLYEWEATLVTSENKGVVVASMSNVDNSTLNKVRFGYPVYFQPEKTISNVSFSIIFK